MQNKDNITQTTTCKMLYKIYTQLCVKKQSNEQKLQQKWPDTNNWTSVKSKSISEFTLRP